MKERSDLAPDGLPPLSLPFVIIDEACQSIEPATLIPIVSSDCCRALVLLGDPCQLPPTVKCRAAQSLSLSLMERLAATLPNPNVIPAVDATIKDVSYLTSAPIRDTVSLIKSRSQIVKGTQQPKSYRKLFNGSILLSIQYRMHPSIAAIPSAIFYDGLLSTPQIMNGIRSFPSSLSNLLPCADPRMCVRLIDVGGGNNERQGTPTSNTLSAGSSTSSITTITEPFVMERQTTYWNDAEAQRILLLLKSILIDQSKATSIAKSPITSIGIISPYNGQVQLIKLLIANDVQIRDLIADRRQKNKIPISIEVKSVDGYQGRERDVIIVSTVRSNRRSQIGFVNDWRRMNVAITRAKSALLIVGDLHTLSTADKNWDALRRWASAVRCIVDDSDNPKDEVSV
jgi:superfamily I DNA and/or RNA helicase